MEKVANETHKVEKEAVAQHKEWHRPVVTRMEMKRTMIAGGSIIDGFSASSA